MNKLKLFFLSFVTLMLSISTSWAGNVTIPNTFQAGTAAVAADVNANFDAVETEVDDNDTRITTNTSDIATNTSALSLLVAPAVYDYNTYLSDILNGTILSKTYSVTGLCNGNAVSSTTAFATATVGSDTQVTVTRTRLNGASAVCQRRVLTFLATAEQYQLDTLEAYNNAGTVLNNTYNYTPAIPLFLQTMVEGKPYGEASVSAPDVTHNVIKNVVLSSESVTATVNSVATVYNNCLKIHATRVRTAGSGGSWSRISWVCPQVGLVRRIQGNGAGSIQTWELTTIQN